MAMKKIVLTGIRRIEMHDVPEPVIAKADEVLLRMETIGICGSDVHYYTTGRIGSQVVQYPFAVGHESAGTVLEVGPAVAALKPGDRVAIDPAMPCGQCDQCRKHRTHTCRQLRFLGCPGQAEGCLSERLVMPAGSLFPIDAAMSFEQAALSEPLSIGMYAVKLSGIGSGARVAILGAGPIGLSVMVAAHAAGAAALYVTDPIDGRLTMAERFGVDWSGNPLSLDPVAAISAREPLLLDAVFECCGQASALDQAVEMLAPGGTLMLVGIPEVDRIAFSIDTLRRRELRLLNVRRQNECVQPALDLLASGRYPVETMVTHRFPFEHTREAFDLVAAYGDNVVKAMITMNP